MKEEKDHGEFILPLNNELPSRSSSMSCSSRLYYYRRTVEGVPFQWEMQPGTPKTPPLTEAILPPISPPPAALSLALPNPSRPPLNKHPFFLLFTRPWWKQPKPKSQKRFSCPLDQFQDGRSRFGSSGSHFHFIESPYDPKSSSSWSSSSSSSSSSFSLSSVSVPAPLPPAESSGHQQLGCSPWRINPVKIAIGRRV